MSPATLTARLESLAHGQPSTYGPALDAMFPERWTVSDSRAWDALAPFLVISSLAAAGRIRRK